MAKDWFVWLRKVRDRVSIVSLWGEIRQGLELLRSNRAYRCRGGISIGLDSRGGNERIVVRAPYTQQSSGVDMRLRYSRRRTRELE